MADKGKKKWSLKKSEYLERKKNFLDEIKNIFHSSGRAIIWWEIEIWEKIEDASFKKVWTLTLKTCRKFFFFFTSFNRWDPEKHLKQYCELCKTRCPLVQHMKYDIFVYWWKLHIIHYGQLKTWYLIFLFFVITHKSLTWREQKYYLSHLN